MFVTGAVVLRLFRSRNPLSQLFTALKVLVRYWSVRQAEQALRGEHDNLGFLPKFQQFVERAWRGPSLALEKAGFRREVVRAVNNEQNMAGNLVSAHALWQSAVDQEIDASAQRASGILLQASSNVIPMAFLAWICWGTVTAFLRGEYLPWEYFRHAGIALLFLIFFIFALIQGIIAVLVFRNISKRIRDRFAKHEIGFRSPVTEWKERLEEVQAFGESSGNFSSEKFNGNVTMM
jgi:hypothetical protein